MNNILTELRLPGHETRSIVIRRGKNNNSAFQKIGLQIELDLVIPEIKKISREE
jgi:hypothetical protein